MPGRERIVFDRFEYRGFYGCRCVCSLEVLYLPDGRVAVIATERQDNPGTSVTNVAEHLASEVCNRLRIDPDHLVWIETYGYPAPGDRQRTFDLVSFKRRDAEGVIQWAPSVLTAKPDGWPGYFQDPSWQPMRDEDWQTLGIAPRAAVGFEV